MSYTIVVPVQSTSGFQNGLTVTAWAVSRFGNANVPAEGTAVPSGTADATATTSTQGGPGQAVLTLPSNVAYNICVTDGQGVNWWTQTSEAIGGAAATAVQSVTSADGTITIGGTSTAPTVKVGTVPASQVSGLGTAATQASSAFDAAGAAATAQTAAQTYADRYAGSAAGTASRPLAATDASVTNARTPTSHAATHAAAGTDPVAISASQVSGLGTAATQPSTAFDAAGAAAAVQTNLTTEATTRASADTSLLGQITAEIARAEAAEALLATPNLSATSVIKANLAETVTYPPNAVAKGNTGILVIQNETLAFLPPVSNITQNGTVWTITFASSILGTLGAVGEQFGCWLTGFAPAAYNIGAGTSPYLATITSSTTATIPNTTTGSGSLTAWGVVNVPPKQYTLVNTADSAQASTFTGGAPRSILQFEGTNTFQRSVDATYGLGPVVQNTMAYKPSSTQLTGVICTNGSNAFKVAGDQRAVLIPLLRVYGPALSNTVASGGAALSASGTLNVGSAVTSWPTAGTATIVASDGNHTVSWTSLGSNQLLGCTYSGNQAATLAAGAAITANSMPAAATINSGSIYYDGTYTYWNCYAAQTFTASTWLAPSGSYTFQFVTDLAPGESYVNAPTTYSMGQPTSFPANSSTFAAPGQGQGWYLGQFDQPLFNTTTNGGSLANVNVSNYYGCTFIDQNTTGIQRLGFTASDIFNGLPLQSFQQQIGFLAGQLQPDSKTIYPLVGAQQNIGVLNASTTATPSAPPFCAVQSYSAGTLTVSNPNTPTNGTNGFPTAGTLTITAQQGLFPIVMTYTGVSGNTFTGCTITSGSFGTIVPGQLLCWLTATAIGYGVPNAYYFTSNAFVFGTPLSTLQYLWATTTVSYVGSTNYMLPGAFDGQTVTYMGADIGSVLTLATVTTASAGFANIALSQPSITLKAYQSITLVYNKAFNTWVQTSLGTPLPSQGGTMSGAIAMGSNRITGLSAPGAASDPALASQLPVSPTPQGSGFKAVTVEPESVASTFTPSSGTLYLFRIDLSVSTVLTNILVRPSVAASGLTIGQFYLFNTTGTLLASTTNSTTWAAGTNYSMPFTSAYTAAAGSYYIGMLFYGTSSPVPPVLYGSSGTSAYYVNATAPSSSPWLAGNARCYSISGYTAAATTIAAAATVNIVMAFLGVT